MLEPDPSGRNYQNKNRGTNQREDLRMRKMRNRNFNPFDCADGQEKTIPALRYRLDDLRMFGIVLKRFAKLPDASFQDVIGDKRVLPYLPDQLFLGNDVSVRLGQADQYLHHLGLKVGLFTTPLNP